MYNLPEQYQKSYAEAISAIKKLNAEKKILLQGSEYLIGEKIIKNKRNFKANPFKAIKGLIERHRKFKKGEMYTNSPALASYESKAPNFFSSERIAIYTCIIGKYDSLLEPAFIPNNCDFFAITSFDIPQTSSWKRIDPKEYLPQNNDFSSVLKNRFFKMHPEKIFKDYKYSVYLDGNIRICTDMTEYVNRIPQNGLAFFKHSQRTCVFEESKACVAMGKSSEDCMKSQVEYLRQQGMPEEYGLPTCCIIAREHDNAKCRQVMDTWWNEFLKFPYRDQLSITLALFQNGISVDMVSTLGNNVYEDPSFEFVKHFK